MRRSAAIACAAPAACRCPRCSAAPVRSCLAAASPAWRPRAPCCAAASTTSHCSNCTTSRAATAAAIGSPACPARSARTTCRCPVRRRRKSRSGCTRSGCCATRPAAPSPTSGTCATARRNACSSTALGTRACCRPPSRAPRRWRSIVASRRSSRERSAKPASRCPRTARRGRQRTPRSTARPLPAGSRAKTSTMRDCAGTSTTAAATITARASTPSRPGPGCIISPAATASARRTTRRANVMRCWPGPMAMPGWCGTWPHRWAIACTAAAWCGA